ncbi:hypothetical protein PILCRDRAFT_8829 [Piloderma croceum F 1598]|uniref:Autophagy-related protein 9 n=1 Tax=Piloderma croceum (strain F 1598) TaxID=765440 RepID=A0A0C3F9Z2_PILCF|nr:hypothetical protein PILCRDRAFT_8829 [Piloderma croceum F 1598]
MAQGRSPHRLNPRRQPLTALSSAKAPNAATTSTAKLDAHNIANRIVRQENYLIALFNKELLDLHVPLLPALDRLVGGKVGRRLGPDGEGIEKMLTRPLVWNLRFCLMGLLFDPQGRVRKVYLKGKNRTALIEGLRRGFIFIGILNAIFVPFIVLYLLIFVAFISGSFAAVLLLASVIDPDLFVHFEVTPHRTVLFYLGVFGSIMAGARGMMPDDNGVFDPELLMEEVIRYTHYMPGEWKDQMHSKQVFGELFAMKIAIIVQELVLTLFVLWFSLPQCTRNY